MSPYIIFYISVISVLMRSYINLYWDTNDGPKFCYGWNLMDQNVAMDEIYYSSN